MRGRRFSDATVENDYELSNFLFKMERSNGRNKVKAL